MESASISGADLIAQMSIMERTKRAMLAEAVEDRIFSLQDDLDTLILSDNSDGLIPKDETLREQCVDLAKQIKAAQGQYRELVSGESSGMLQKFESLGNTMMSSGSRGNNEVAPVRNETQEESGNA